MMMQGIVRNGLAFGGRPGILIYAFLALFLRTPNFTTKRRPEEMKSGPSRK